MAAGEVARDGFGEMGLQMTGDVIRTTTSTRSTAPLRPAREPAWALIEIAHPNFRDELTEGARRVGLLRWWG